jgi:hypothetical protein
MGQARGAYIKLPCFDFASCATTGAPYDRTYREDFIEAIGVIMEATTDCRTQSEIRWWSIASYALLVAFLVAAVLNYFSIPGGFLTSHCADIAIPAWLYIIYRGLNQPKRTNIIVTRYIGKTPETCAVVMFGASAFTEICQYYWPRGIFNGYYDPLDILAFAAGVGVCYGFDKRALRKHAGASLSKS